MRPDDVRSLLRQQPFQPFRLFLADGSSYEIRHPDQVMVERSTVVIAVTIAGLPVPLADCDIIVALCIFRGWSRSKLSRFPQQRRQRTAHGNGRGDAPAVRPR